MPAMSENSFFFAGGGTGGHLYPGLAVAAALRARQPEAQITFLTTTRPLDRSLLESLDYEQIEQAVRPFTMHPLRVRAFWWHWWRSVAAARKLIRQRKPRAVLGLGGYAAGPAVVAAAQLGTPAAILNPDAVPGLANRLLGRRVSLIATQWDASRTHFKPGAPCRTLGCPIRAEFAAVDQTAGRQHFELALERPVLLVTGASQGARTVNRVVQRVWPQFVQDHPEWQLLHLTGPADEAETRAAYEQAGVGAQVLAFTHQMWLAIAAADVVVSRAGASTLAELTAVGRPSILLPYPYHRDRHQHANAQVLVDAGAGLMIEDQLEPELNAGPLRAALDRLEDRAARAVMADAAARLGRPNAAQAVAAWMLGEEPEGA